MPSDLASWCAALEQARESGVMTCRVHDREHQDHRDHEDDAKDLGLLLAGFRNMFHEGAAREIDRSLARRVLVQVLAFDLAHHMDELEPERAGRVAADFLSLFADDARFFTNARFVGEDEGGALFLRAWYGLTSALHDTGVVAVDARRVGMLWVRDDD